MGMTFDRIDLDQPRFIQADVLKLAPGLTAKTLQNWNGRGIFKTANPFPGKQAKRKYSAIDVIALNFMLIAANLGIAPATAHKVALQITNRATELHDALDPTRINEVGLPEWIIEAGNPEYRKGYILKHAGRHVTFIIDEKEYRAFRTMTVPDAYIVVEVDFIILQTFNRIYANIAGVDLKALGPRADNEAFRGIAEMMASFTPPGGDDSKKKSRSASASEQSNTEGHTSERGEGSQ
jgi:hypothetical protein